jgi:uncharacterized protein DUF3810
VRVASVAAQAAIVSIAVAAALFPLPADAVERYYSSGWYPVLQAHLTAWSNETRLSLFDALIVVVSIVLLAAWARWIGRSWRSRSIWPLIRAIATTAVAASIFYLWFLLAWGLNYARVPLETVVGYEPSRVTDAALRALATRATDAVNATYAAGHAAGFPGAGEIPPSLVTAFHDLERTLGRTRGITPSRPKRTLLAPFFRAAGVDGMHAPFLLETLLNDDLTPPERPAVLAHEWAHLAGYAPEDDASFVGLLAALRADPGSRYSAWLALFDDVVGQLPRADQRVLVARLAAGPVADRRAIAARLRSLNPTVSRASWETYDQYLKAQGVRDGVQSYSRVVQLLLGSTMGSGLISDSGIGSTQNLRNRPGE